jgi:DNA-directed RNA polymerase subunit RPC12/RpoP
MGILESLRLRKRKKPAPSAPAAKETIKTSSVEETTELTTEPSFSDEMGMVMHCPECGKRLDGGSKVCKHCGAKLE